MEDEKVSICAVIETRIKSKKLQEIGDGIFRQWEWINNMKYCDKGCRIIMGWDSDKVNLNMLHCYKQSILCRIEDKKGKLLVFCSIVYAANVGNKRVDLWKELSLYKRIVSDHPWCIMGDMNVTLDPSKHTTGGSSMTKDMQDFKDYVNSIEVKDIASSWNEAFVEEFLEIVKENWNSTHNGCQMFKVTRKLNGLKKPLKRLAWKDGDLFDKVKILREKLKDIQKRIDTEPHNKVIREEESLILREYGEAMKEEEKAIVSKG
ncbi:RNA-directed DNA polymerase, eukaryota, reverse transcriptase zinc-binding domain protein [Tanacetum coccineum]